MNRRTLLIAGTLAPLALTPGARAATVTPFTEAAFRAAQAADKPILVAIHASWCPVCAKQRPILSQLEADPAFSKLAVFMVDFDKQKDVVHALGAKMQSTLIAFHGAHEMDRSVGATDPAAIRALLNKALV